jgi:iron complex outermembrane receptor protein
MNRNFIRSVRACAAAAAALCAVPAVLAQEAPSGRSATAGGLEEITVTARRREEMLQDVPISLSAFSGEDLESAGAIDITWLQQTTPNLTLQVARGSNSTLIAFIRGIGQQDPLWGFEPGVGLYVDDVYVARPQGAVLDIFDIERIEVLRGPQGTLYGRNTIGGAIKYVTRPLGDEVRFDGRINVGSYGQHDVIASMAAPVTDTFSVGGSVALYRRDGYGKNKLTGEEHYNKDVDAARFSAEWRPADSLLFRLAADWVQDSSNARHGHREAPGAGLTAGEPVLKNIYDTRGGIGSDNRVETDGVSLLAQWAINDVFTLKSITAYREGDTDTVIDFDNSPTPALDVPGVYADRQFTQELQLLFEGERWQGVAGLFYLDAMARGKFDTIVGLINTTIATSGQVDTESVAAFADVSFDITDALSASVGGRWTSDDREGTVYRQNFTGLYSPLFGNDAAIPGLVRSNYTNDKSFDEFTPRVSVTYEFSDDLTTYAAYSEGFKSGGFDMRGDAVLTPDTVNGYDPEYVKSYEVGLKGSVLDQRLGFNLALFRADYEGQQITRQEPTVTGSIASFVDNAADSTIQGVELEGTISFTDNLTATYGVGYVDAEFDKYTSTTVVPNPSPPPATITVPIDLSDSAQFQNTPEWNANLALSYRHDLAERGSVLGTVRGSYRSEYSMFEFENELIDQTDDYTLVDVDLVWTLANGRTTIGAHGRNLTDEEYKIGGYYFPGATFGNVVSSFYGPPRTYTLTLGYSFR